VMLKKQESDNTLKTLLAFLTTLHIKFIHCFFRLEFFNLPINTVFKIVVPERLSA